MAKPVNTKHQAPSPTTISKTPSLVHRHTTQNKKGYSSYSTHLPRRRPPRLTAGTLATDPMRHHRPGGDPLPPLVVALNCLEDVSAEREALAGVAAVEHVGLSRIADGRIETAAAVLLHSLAFLPRAAQRRLQPWHLVLCLGSPDRAADSALAADLNLRLVHVDAARAEEVADTVMALFLGLLRRTHALSRNASSAASGWLGSIQPLCKGMRRCRGLVLGIVGRSASARCLASRSLAFRMSVLYFDVLCEGDGNIERHTIAFPPAARRMDTLNDLLAASDLISLHCSLSNETIHILNADCLQHIKPGAFIVNTGSSQLIDDCALKQLLIDGVVAGCALDGAEGPQWMEAWVREMPNVLILPRSADYSEEVWMEIREKAISVLQTFFLDGVVPESAVSDDEENNPGFEEDVLSERQVRESSLNERMSFERQLVPECNTKKTLKPLKEAYTQSQGSGPTQSMGSLPEGRCSRSGKKGKKRSARRRSQPKSDESSGVEGSSNSTSQWDDDPALSGRDQVLMSSSSVLASPEDSRSKQICLAESSLESSLESLDRKGLKIVSNRKTEELLKEGYVIALYAKNKPGFHVSRQRLHGGGWYLDIITNVTKRDPAAQFIVSFRSKDTIGLRSFAAGGKLLQINRRMEFVFASHSFDVWENWAVEGSLEECRLINCRNPSAVLDVKIEILAVVGEEDGVTRWLD